MEEVFQFVLNRKDYRPKSDYRQATVSICAFHDNKMVWRDTKNLIAAVICNKFPVGASFPLSQVGKAFNLIGAYLDS